MPANGDESTRGEFDIEFSHAESATDTPVLREVARILGRSQRPSLTLAITMGTLFPEDFRALGVKVRALCAARGVRTVAITSPLPGDGKTTTAAGLAGALGREQGARVLLMEADLRRPVLDASLGLPRDVGVADFLEGRSSTVAVRRLMPHRFHFVGAGAARCERPELVKSPRMRKLLDAVRGHFDLTILDCPPVLPVADTLMLQELVDCFLLVVRERVTPIDAIDHALAQFAPDRLAGIVLNGHRPGLRESYAYSRYYRQGYGSGQPQGR